MNHIGIILVSVPYNRLMLLIREDEQIPYRLIYVGNFVIFYVSSTSYVNISYLSVGVSLSRLKVIVPVWDGMYHHRIHVNVSVGDHIVIDSRMRKQVIRVDWVVYIVIYVVFMSQDMRDYQVYIGRLAPFIFLYFIYGFVVSIRHSY